MPKSTIAVSLVAVFLLGLLLGQQIPPRVASAGPTDVSSSTSSYTLLATGTESQFATLWQVRENKVVGAVRYFPGGTSSVESLSQIRLEVPSGADAKPPK